ncbi:ABC transporter substrate binding protein, partial [Lysinibacillus sp. F5]|uniref:ABC transporter substrate binding protein n=1 Tax=Lysinibacillus sp. F5 TaxID=1700846 RepID=UPI000AA0DB53
MKNSVKKLSFLLFGLVLLLAACGSGGSSSTNSKGNESNNASESGNTEDKTYKIGITQIVEHPSLNAATEGFKKAIEDAGLKVDYDPQIAQGDNSLNTTIANNLVSEQLPVK